MKRILILSSYVAQGTVGLQATVPAFDSPAFEVIAVPTVVLSNHPGHRACAGTAVAPETLAAMLDALAANGWLRELDVLLLGYMPSPDHVRWAATLAQGLKLQGPELTVVVDPVLGDDPQGLYVRPETAAAIRDNLLPLADLITPNRFELAWLSACTVDGPETATNAARTLHRPTCAATSIPADGGRIANLLISDSLVAHENADLVPQAPHGTGDYFAGALVAARLLGHGDREALRIATLEVARALHVSSGLDYLRFAAVTTGHPGRG